MRRKEDHALSGDAALGSAMNGRPPGLFDRLVGSREQCCGIETSGSLAAARLIASSEPRVWGPDQNFALAKRTVATLLADVGESRFENVTDWLPPASVELKKSQMFDRPKARRSSADCDPW